MLAAGIAYRDYEPYLGELYTVRYRPQQFYTLIGHLFLWMAERKYFEDI